MSTKTDNNRTENEKIDNPIEQNKTTDTVQTVKLVTQIAELIQREFFILINDYYIHSVGPYLHRPVAEMGLNFNYLVNGRGVHGSGSDK